MKKKILIVLSTLLVLCVVLSIVIFAKTSDEAFEYGDRFDNAHGNNTCCTAGSDEPHYNVGYEDGWKDGYDSQQSTVDSLLGELGNQDTPGDTEDGDLTESEWKRKYTQLLAMYNDKCTDFDEMTAIGAEYVNALNEANGRIESLGGNKVDEPVLDGKNDYSADSIIEESVKQNVINNYISSNEYQIVINSHRESAVNEYKTSDEYKDTMKEYERIGTEQAYEIAKEELYDSIYNVGVADGFTQYAQTEQYQVMINDIQQKAYNTGAIEGYEQGKADSTTFDVTEFVSVILSLIGTSVISALILRFVKKRRKKG